MSKLRRDWLFSLAIAAACIGLAFVDLTGIPDSPTGFHARGRVTAVDNSHVKTHLIVKTQSQFLTVRLLDGPHRGEEVSVTNRLTGKMELDEFYQQGATILVEYDLTEGKPGNAVARGHYRLRLQLLLIVLFGCLLAALAGVTGLKALLSFVVTAMMLWKLYFPLVLLGYPAISSGLAVVALLTGVVTFSVGGINRLGTATFLGSMLGVLLTCGLAVWFAHAFKLHGAVRPFAEPLLYSGFAHLQLTEIFIASVFIASSGAIMDLAMDIAASMDEIKSKQPQIDLREHIRSGVRVGRAVIGTMTTTLLLAYSASHITMFLLFMAKGLPAANILNAPFLAAEILNILVGSFGLVTVAPFTVLVAGLLYHFQPVAEGRSGESTAGAQSFGQACPVRAPLECEGSHTASRTAALTAERSLQGLWRGSGNQPAAPCKPPRG